MIPTETAWRGRKRGWKWDVWTSYLTLFVVDLIAWVCIRSQFLHGLPVKLGMRVGFPIPICSIVHSTWLSLTCTASCRWDSHEPTLPLRKEAFATHRLVSHDPTVYRIIHTHTHTQKTSLTEIFICTLVCCEEPLLPLQGSIKSSCKNT